MSDLTTKQHITGYIKALAAIEEEMEPYKEHKRDLRNNYVKNGWLTKDEMRQAVRAYRMMKKGDNIDEFNDFYDAIVKGA